MAYLRGRVSPTDVDVSTTPEPDHRQEVYLDAGAVRLTLEPDEADRIAGELVHAAARVRNERARQRRDRR